MRAVLVSKSTKDIRPLNQFSQSPTFSIGGLQESKESKESYV